MEKLPWPTLVFAGLSIGAALGRSLPDLAFLKAKQSGQPPVTQIETPSAKPENTTAKQPAGVPQAATGPANTLTKPQEAADAHPAGGTQKITAPADPVDQLQAASKPGADYQGNRETLRIVESIPADSIASVLTQVISRRTTQYPLSARLLAGRLAFEQPRAAVKWLTETAPQDSRSVFSGVIFRAWSERDPAAAKAALSSVADPEIKRSAASALGIAPEDTGASSITQNQSKDQTEPVSAAAIAYAGSAHPAETARRLLADFPPSGNRLDAIGNLASAWVRENPSDALRWAQSLQILGERKQATMFILDQFPPEALVSEFRNLSSAEKNEARSAIRRWASRDPGAAAKWLASQPTWNGRAQAAQNIASEWAATDPRAAVAFALKELPAGTPLQCTMATIAGKWAEKDPGAALDLTETLRPSTLRHCACIQIMKAWAKANAQAAADYLTAFPKGELKDELVAPVVEAWAAADPRNALALAEQISAASDRESAMLSALSLWSKSDPDAAAKYLYEIPPGEAKDNLIGSVSRKFVERDAQRALQWAVGFPDPRDRQSALYHTITSWASEHPEAAAAYTLVISDAETRDRVAPDVAHRWADKNPETAARWAASLPEGKGRQDSLSRVMSAWAEKDEGAAARWLDNLPDGPSRDAVVSSYVYRLVHKDPETAFRWSESVQNEAERHQLISTSAMFWLRSDPQKARAALQASGLPEQRKRMVLEMSQEGLGRSP